MAQMGRKIVYDRNKIHAYMWHLANSRGILTVTSRQIAEDLGIHEIHFNRIIKGFFETGRIMKLNKGQRTLRNYIVVDPTIYAQETGDRKGEKIVARELLRLNPPKVQP